MRCGRVRVPRSALAKGVADSGEGNLRVIHSVWKASRLTLGIIRMDEFYVARSVACAPSESDGRAITQLTEGFPPPVDSRAQRAGTEHRPKSVTHHL
jgi:hypothetical protein